MADQIHATGTETAAIVPEVWSQRFQEVNRALLPFNDSISRDYEGKL
jgi:hypothetical protein